MDTNADLIERLNEPELYYPSNFDTVKRANAMLSGLCQEAADAIESADKRIAELEAQLACAPSRICKVPMLEAELAAAQATIANMRQRFSDITTVAKQYAGAYPTQIATLADDALALPTNLDQLHEDRAQQIDKVITRLLELGALGDGTYVEELRSMAENHRALKGEWK